MVLNSSIFKTSTKKKDLKHSRVLLQSSGRTLPALREKKKMSSTSTNCQNVKSPALKMESASKKNVIVSKASPEFIVKHLKLKIWLSDTDTEISTFSALSALFLAL
jgi:hypothetical protein